MADLHCHHFFLCVFFACPATHIEYIGLLFWPPFDSQISTVRYKPMMIITASYWRSI